jgi:nucleoside-triphosphatase THEP1
MLQPYKIFNSAEFTDRDSEFARVETILKEKSRGAVIFDGERGSGKTTFLFELYRRLQERSELRPFLISLFPYSAPEFESNKNIWLNAENPFQRDNIPYVLDRLARYLEIETIETEDRDFQKDYFARGLAYRASKTVPVLLVDSIYECPDETRIDIEKYILAPLLASERVFIILSGRGRRPIWSRPELQNADFFTLSPLEDIFIREQLLKLKERGKLRRDPNELDAIVELSGGNPLIARALAESEKPLLDALSEAIDIMVWDALPSEAKDEKIYSEIRSQLEKLALIDIPFRTVDVESYLYGEDLERRRKTNRLLDLLKASHLMVYEGKGNHLNQSIVYPMRKWLKAQGRVNVYLTQLQAASLRLQEEYPTVKGWYEKMIPRHLMNTH